jgi:hypothetical protein
MEQLKRNNEDTYSFEVVHFRAVAAVESGVEGVHQVIVVPADLALTHRSIKERHI